MVGGSLTYLSFCRRWSWCTRVDSPASTNGTRAGRRRRASRPVAEPHMPYSELRPGPYPPAGCLPLPVRVTEWRWDRAAPPGVYRSLSALRSGAGTGPRSVSGTEWCWDRAAPSGLCRTTQGRQRTELPIPSRQWSGRTAAGVSRHRGYLIGRLFSASAAARGRPEGAPAALRAASVLHVVPIGRVLV